MALADNMAAVVEEAGRRRGVRLPKPVGCIRVAARNLPDLELISHDCDP
jgi:hypothetical protein